MCAGCMSVVDLIHADYFLPDERLSDSLETGVRMAVAMPDGEPLTKHEVGTLLIVAGARMITWEPNDGEH